MIVNIHVTFGLDGRMKFKSPDVPGLFLASNNLSALARDLDEATRDSLRLNLGLTPEKIGYRFHSAEPPSSPSGRVA